MAKGRKPVYQSEDEKPVMVSVRIPSDLYNRMEDYRRIHKQSVTELLLDGLRMRLDTPADPRDIILSDDNTVIRELQDMIRTQVQAEIGKLQTFMGSAMDALTLAPAPETAAPLAEVLADAAAFLEDEDDEAMPVPEGAGEPVAELSYDSNTVLQDGTEQTAIPPQASPPPEKPRGAMRQRILQLLGEHPEGLSADELRVYLKPQKPLGDTLQGMVRQHLLAKQGSGQAVRYRALQKHQGQPA